MLRDNSPTSGHVHFGTGNALPSPPYSPRSDPLDDIYGSAPSSPVLSSHEPTHPGHDGTKPDEILSDLPSRQRALDTDAYREGLANSKGQYVQEGFDEGYSLGANLGLRVGYILGVLQGFVSALRGHDEERWEEAKGLWEGAQRELAIEELLGQKWVNEEGVFKWDVKGEEEEVTFREVADHHPVIKKWLDEVKSLAMKLEIDLEALERDEEVNGEEQS
ncbi:hypothetical protein P154DRAFT_193998 [Amniculicola lignicola CBS 123094]|uniref:Protein YAE1 n=1 Tax=Amniculicola lignicola CBS 123094 TaxID=1392246 RepID=A0A6A5WFS1_9PLEO|nr:hypothetical protein P154DRAFT_193998 [Amniculicola lignicola CBS 123094]